MSETKVFGIKLGVDPKIIVVGLVVIAGLIYYLTSGSTTEGSTAPAPVVAMNTPVAQPTFNAGRNVARLEAARRNRQSLADRNVLKLAPVDGSHGDVDPTLRLSLLERVKNVPSATGARNLFDSGGVVVAGNLPAMPKNPPKIMPKPTIPPPPAVATNTPPPPPPFSIPLKYYGFVKPTAHSVDGNRGFFMDGDNVLVGGEGDMLEKRFLIVALTPNNARLEDTQAKQGQDLPVTPEAQPAQ